MKECSNEQLIAFANMVVDTNPNLNFLKADLWDQYSPLIKLLHAQLDKKHQAKRLLLPELKKDGNQTIGIFSDYGGESSDSKYYTYTFLICGWNHSFGLGLAMEDIRKKHGLKNKEIAFKDFNYGPIKRSLNEYLRALDTCVVGYLYTVIVEKEITSFFQGEGTVQREIAEALKSNGFGGWKPKVAEKLLRIVHIAAYLVSLLSANGQKIFWMTDHDEIAPNIIMQDNMLNVFQSVLPLYTDNHFELIGGAVPFKEKDIHMLDLLSAADVAAGSLEHYFTRSKVLEELTIKSEANQVLSWLSRDGISLKKNTVIIKQENGMLTSAEVDIQDNSPSESDEFIGIKI